MIRELNRILQQVHEPDEYSLVPENLTHPLYWVWKLPNSKMKDLNINLRPYRKEHSRFDIFINGQYILEKDYTFQQVGNDIHIYFIKENFQFQLETDDDIKLEGDVDSL